MNNNQQLTMYKNNSRDSSKFRGFSPLQLPCNLPGKCHAVGYYSYTQRCVELSRPTTNELYRKDIKL